MVVTKGLCIKAGTATEHYYKMPHGSITVDIVRGVPVPAVAAAGAPEPGDETALDEWAAREKGHNAKMQAKRGSQADAADREAVEDPCPSTEASGP